MINYKDKNKNGNSSQIRGKEQLKVGGAKTTDPTSPSFFLN